MWKLRFGSGKEEEKWQIFFCSACSDTITVVLSIYFTSSIQYSGAHIRNSGIAYLLYLEFKLLYLLCGSNTGSNSHCWGNSFIAEQHNKIVRASFVLSVFFFLFFLLFSFFCHGIWKLPDGCLVERKFVKVLEEMEETSGRNIIHVLQCF